jgi:hypothetical protein
MTQQDGLIVSRKDAAESGQRYYFTGKACKFGHVSSRWVSDGKCCACEKHRMQARNKNPNRQAYMAERMRSPEWRAYAQAYMADYNANPDRKKMVSQYRQTPEYKARESARRTLPHVKARRKSDKRVRAQSVTQACPEWADRRKIAEIYALCPDGFHVDHIVPLRGVTHDGREVCGLHVEWNLRYLPASVNVSRGNRISQQELDLIECQSGEGL